MAVDLVVGGTSGLGLEIAREFAERDRAVIVTGRRDPKVEFAEFRRLELSKSGLPRRIGNFVMKLPEIDSLVYAAGYYQRGRITELEDHDIQEMLRVGGEAPTLLLRHLLLKQGGLDQLVMITSTSQWTVREEEPVYNFVKSGEAMFSRALALDTKTPINRVLIAAPAGMQTPFWEGTDHPEYDKMNDPAWVAKTIVDVAIPQKRTPWEIHILRDPPRVESVK